MQVQSSRYLARKVALNQVAYEDEAKGLKKWKIQAFIRWNDGSIVDGALKNRNRTNCNVIETITILNLCKFKANYSSKAMLH